MSVSAYKMSIAVNDERSGVVTAAITSARDLPEAERAEFKKNLEKNNVKIRFPEYLRFIIEISCTIFDII